MGFKELMSPVPPAALFMLFFSTLSFDLIFGIKEATLSVILSRIITYTLMLTFAFIRASHWWSDVTIEIDGYICKRGKGYLPLSDTLKNPQLVHDINSNEDDSVDELASPVDGTRTGKKWPSWPPQETLTWTPFKSIPFALSDDACFWSRGDSSAFHVRQVGYSKSGQKAPSSFALYETLGVDLVRSSKKMISSLHTSPVIKKVFSPSTQSASYLAEVPWPWHQAHEAGSGWWPGCGLPRVIMINCQIPLEAPSLWSNSKAHEDPGFSAVVYLSINPLLLDALSAGREVPNSVGLLRKFVKEGKSSKDGVALKAIGLVENASELGLPDIVNKFNGKPVLVTKSCKVNKPKMPGMSEGEYLEIEFDVRLWCYIAKRTLFNMKEKIKEAKMHIGFVLEGGDDSVLPEQLLGCVRLSYMDLDSIKVVDRAL